MSSIRDELVVERKRRITPNEVWVLCACLFDDGVENTANFQIYRLSPGNLGWISSFYKNL